MASEREKILQAAQKYVDKKRYDKAIEEYQKIVREDANDARTLLKIGDLQARMQAYPDAIATYDRVGKYYADQGFALKAIAVYKQIREMIRKHAPDLAERYSHLVPKLAEIYTQLGLTSDALAAYDEVATRLQRSGRDRDAIDVFQKMVELDATNPLPHLRLAEACCRVQELDSAIESFWAAADLLLKLGRRDDALKVVERILHFRQDARYARAAAELYLERGGREDGLQALAKLQICFQADPRDLETLGLLAQAFTLIGQESKAIEVYKEMARVAREQGRADLYGQLVDHLASVAPDDDQVRSMRAAQDATGGPVSAAPSTQSAISVHDADVEIIEDEIAGSQEAAFELDQRHAHPAMVSSPDVVVVDDAVEVAEELLGPDSFDARGHARKAVLDAESFRKLRLYSKAIETLSIALEIDPRAVGIREKLREVLGEAGDRDGAIGESITLSAIYLEQNNVERAEMLLYDVLDLEPEHPVALEMLQQLGAGGHTGYEQQPQQYDEPREPYATVDDAYAQQGYDPNEPLPSYDLEEIGPSQALASERPVQLSQVDDPFAGAQVDDPFGEEAPLPSFPLGVEPDEDLLAGLDEPAAYADEPVAYEDEPVAYEDEPIAFADAEEAPLPSFEDEHGIDFDEPETAEAPTQIAAEPSMEAIEEALEEAEFFASRGLYDDAKAILVDQLSRTPNHPLVLERLQEVEGIVASAGASGTIERSQLGSEPVAEDDHAFDIAASLDALDDLEVTSAIQPEAAGFANANQEVDVDQVFAKFKEGVRAQVSESDAATHYDLGVAYKEMGLLPDAIGEFELAGRDPVRECMCFAMIGMIHLERNELDKSADAYKRGLEAEQKTIDQEMSLYYDLGVVYEMKSSADEALYYFHKIARRDPGYRDVKDRIAALEPQPAPKAQTQSRAVGDEDEFDRAFDELFDTK